MSFGEILIVLAASLIILKQEDIPIIAKAIKNSYKYILAFKKQINDELNEIASFGEDTQESLKSGDTINFYLRKIAEYGVKYDGEYDLQTIKAFYHKLLFKNKLSRSDTEKK